jgi:hypothetical protein
VRLTVDHLSEMDLIRLLDHEMSAEENAAASVHLETCERCRADMAELVAVGEEVKGMMSSAPVSAATSASRNALAARLAEGESEARSPHSRFASWISTKLTPVYAYGAAGIVAVAAMFFLLPRLDRSDVNVSASLPIRALTPGMTRPVSLADICASSDNDLDPEVSPQQQEAVFREYGISRKGSPRDFQVDYLISPQLGGTDDVKNLWPQSYKEVVWNAEAKDALERHLSQLVCEGKVSLAEAQSAIATNWVAAYRKYF